MIKIYKDLEFDLILNKLADIAASDVVAEKVAQIEPMSDIDDVNKRLTQTGDAITVLASSKPDLAFDDIAPILDKSIVGAVLSPSELLKIKRSISSLRSLKSCVERTEGCDSLKDITAWVRACDELENKIECTVENENEIKDGASEKLYSLRKAIMRSHARLKERLDGYTRQSEISKYLQDNIVTLRGGRYVLPVRSDCRSNIKGLVHDVSATGATVFIEPYAVVEANNELITLKTEEQNEIERILAELSRSVAVESDRLAAGQEVLTECGIIFAKAEYAKQLNAYRPKLNECGKIVLKGARHPLIAAEKIVPVNITLDEKRVLLISGPNTGGKTVALKSVGLFALMTACGMFIPADDGSEISVFDTIFCDIGDSQSIAQSLSTFSAHITTLTEITANMNAQSLVLLDEVGDGTDPDEGAALAVAIIKKILSSQATAIITTHFNSVKEFAIACEQVENASMQFDSVNFKPTYRLLQGASGSSYALEIAEKLGLSQDIIDDARAALSLEKVSFDKIMREAEKLRNDMLIAKEQCDRLKLEAQESAHAAEKFKIEYEKKLNELNENAKSVIRRKADEYSERAESIIEQIKEQLKNGDEAALFNARKAAKKLAEGVPTSEVKPLNSNVPVKPDELKVGTRVYVSGLNKEGIIASSLRGNKAVVAIGSVKTEIPISSLSLIAEQPIKDKVMTVKADREPENKEIILLGKTVDEAIEELDRILSDISPRSMLRIVHGKGTGALGKGIQAYLKKRSNIKSFRYGRYGEGDTGVTIAEIK